MFSGLLRIPEFDGTIALIFHVGLLRSFFNVFFQKEIHLLFTFTMKWVVNQLYMVKTVPHVMCIRKSKQEPE